MPSIYALKPRFQSLLRPTVSALARIGVTANQITLAGVVLSIACGAAIAFWNDRRVLLLMPLVLLLRMALNAMDGMMAREHNQKTPLGAILNELCDVIADAGLYLPLARVPGFSLWLMATVVIFSILTEMTGVIGVQIGASRRYDGPFGKSDRAFIFGLIGLLLGLGAPLQSALPYVLWIMLLLLAQTVVNRGRGALRELAASGRMP
jgi:CDP-diacylglycerol---glycerol-3-phosphate 3-phosphatidyltransferase